MEKLSKKHSEKLSDQQEYIVDCAVSFKGHIYRAKNHALAMVALENSDPQWDESDEYPIDGFITTAGRFVDRQEAGKIADAAGQLDRLAADEKETAADSLDSADLVENESRHQGLKPREDI
jgi:hypothetical protein